MNRRSYKRNIQPHTVSTPNSLRPQATPTFQQHTPNVPPLTSSHQPPLQPHTYFYDQTLQPTSYPQHQRNHHSRQPSASITVQPSSTEVYHYGQSASQHNQAKQRNYTHQQPHALQSQPFSASNQTQNFSSGELDLIDALLSATDTDTIESQLPPQSSSRVSHPIPPQSTHLPAHHQQSQQQQPQPQLSTYQRIQLAKQQNINNRPTSHNQPIVLQTSPSHKPTNYTIIEELINTDTKSQFPLVSADPHSQTDLNETTPDSAYQRITTEPIIIECDDFDEFSDGDDQSAMHDNDHGKDHFFQGCDTPHSNISSQNSSFSAQLHKQQQQHLHQQHLHQHNSNNSGISSKIHLSNQSGAILTSTAQFQQSNNVIQPNQPHPNNFQTLFHPDYFNKDDNDDNNDGDGFEQVEHMDEGYDTNQTTPQFSKPHHSSPQPSRQSHSQHQQRELSYGAPHSHSGQTQPHRDQIPSSRSQSRPPTNSYDQRYSHQSHAPPSSFQDQDDPQFYHQQQQQQQLMLLQRPPSQPQQRQTHQPSQTATANHRVILPDEVQFQQEQLATLRTIVQDTHLAQKLHQELQELLETQQDILDKSEENILNTSEYLNNVKKELYHIALRRGSRFGLLAMLLGFILPFPGFIFGLQFGLYTSIALSTLTSYLSWYITRTLSRFIAIRNAKIALKSYEQEVHQYQYQQHLRQRQKRHIREQQRQHRLQGKLVLSKNALSPEKNSIQQQYQPASKPHQPLSPYTNSHAQPQSRNQYSRAAPPQQQVQQTGTMQSTSQQNRLHHQQQQQQQQHYQSEYDSSRYSQHAQLNQQQLRTHSSSSTSASHHVATKKDNLPRPRFAQLQTPGSADLFEEVLEEEGMTGDDYLTLGEYFDIQQEPDQFALSQQNKQQRLNTRKLRPQILHQFQQQQQQQARQPTSIQVAKKVPNHTSQQHQQQQQQQPARQSQPRPQQLAQPVHPVNFSPRPANYSAMNNSQHNFLTTTTTTTTTTTVIQNQQQNNSNSQFALNPSTTSPHRHHHRHQQQREEEQQQQPQQQHGYYTYLSTLPGVDLVASTFAQLTSPSTSTSPRSTTRGNQRLMGIDFAPREKQRQRADYQEPISNPTSPRI